MRTWCLRDMWSKFGCLSYLSKADHPAHTFILKLKQDSLKHSLLQMYCNFFMLIRKYLFIYVLVCSNIERSLIKILCFHCFLAIYFLTVTHKQGFPRWLSLPHFKTAFVEANDVLHPCGKEQCIVIMIEFHAHYFDSRTYFLLFVSQSSSTNICLMPILPVYKKPPQMVFQAFKMVKSFIIHLLSLPPPPLV